MSTDAAQKDTLYTIRFGVGGFVRNGVRKMANEKRLIYLEDAKEALTGWETDPTDEEIEYTLDDLLTVEAVEVVHGRWNAIDECANSGVYCSVCHRKIFKECYGNCKLRSNYCPNCGAKMDGGNEDV